MQKTLRSSTALSSLLLPALIVLTILGCNGQSSTPAPETTAGTETPSGSAATGDPHSFARPAEVAVEHLELDLGVDFPNQQLVGRASLRLARNGEAQRLHLDTRDLDIKNVELDDGQTATFELGPEQPFLGRELIVELAPETTVVHVVYATDPKAAALQWLAPQQTSGGEHPFLFTQSQAILARTWVPCQDSPAVRMTYDATIRVPAGLMAVMSAENPTTLAEDGVYRFTMPQAIPSYLLALGVGDLEFRAMGPRTGVYAEPAVVEKAAWEFAETEQMIDAIEPIYGPYLWGRYDLLVLPPSFPFGGMENPRLTFLTPTVLAGDRSLVALVAHELAHSWSGNLVTNANWNDFWLNEGFTVYLERRIMEEIQGRDYADMLTRLGLQDLEKEIEDLGPDSPDTHLRLDLAGRDPDDGMTDVAYEKGYFFLRMLEETVGRETWDAFLRDYFTRHAFQSLTTEQFEKELRAGPLADEALAERLQIDAWLYGPNLPGGAPEIASRAFDRVDEQLAAWVAGQPAKELDTESWTTHEWMHFLRGLPETLPRERLAELDAAFGFTESGNSEILNAWLRHAITNRYQPAYPALERFLTGMGRRKFLRPLYQRLVDTGQGELAREIYERARPGYHSVATETIDKIVLTGP